MPDIRREAAKCLLCKDAACSRACPNGFDPARMIRSARFDNVKGAADFVDSEKCAVCAAPCEGACIHYDAAVRIKEMAVLLPEKSIQTDYKNLETDFLGIHCENPFFLSSSVVASSYDMCARALEAGWGGVVYKTIGLFVPNEVSPRFDATSKEGTPFIGFKNLEQISDHTAEQNFNDIMRLKKKYPTKVIVASIMGRTDDEWKQLAQMSEAAGADMIECNFSCPQMCGNGLGSDVGQNPELVEHYTRMTRSGTRLPILAKMTPNLGNMEVPAIAAMNGGADGLAAINTIKSITAVDLETMSSYPDIDGKSAVSGYSGKAVKPIALRFIHDMATCGELSGAAISGMGGIETWRDAAEFIALGCGNVQVTTAVMQYGYRIIDDLRYGLSSYLQEKKLTLSELIGQALPFIVPADMLDRSSVIYPTFGKNDCVGCGRCYISCSDAGHDAISFADGKPRLIAKNCVGCHLCRLVCPTGAIGVGKRVAKP